MKKTIGLTIFQALLVNAAPHQNLKRQGIQTDSASTILGAASPTPLFRNVTTQAPVAAISASPGSNPAVFGTVDESSNGIVYVYTLVPAGTKMLSSGSVESASSITTAAPESSSSETFSTTEAAVIVVSTTTFETTECNSMDITEETTQVAQTSRPSNPLVPSISASSAAIFFQSVTTTTVVASVLVTTVSMSSGIVQILPSLSTVAPGTKGTVITSLASSGAATSVPLITSSISVPTTTLSPTAPATSVLSTVTVGIASDDIFQPVATNAPPSVITTVSDHPVPRLGIEPQDSPIGTNKFYANFFLSSQTAGTWTHPYSVAWAQGGGSAGSWGMEVMHIDDDQRIFGPNSSADPVEYFINPIGIQSMVLSAAELGSSTNISTDTITAFSINVNLVPSPGAQPAVTFPLVQGMSFFTGIYNGTTPLLQSGVFFQSVTKAATDPKPGVSKYTVLLEDGKTWLVYAYSPDGVGLDFTVVNNSLAQATSNFNGIIQIAKNPGGDAEALYDAACGAYPTTATLSGTVNGSTGSYTLSFAKGGMANTTLAMFALPHHVESFDSQTNSSLTTVQLDTTTKGVATAVVADSWTLLEELPVTLGFAPWSPSIGAENVPLSAAAIAAILPVAASEVSQNMNDQTNLTSMYFAGKALAKFAQIVYTINDLCQDPDLGQAGLTELQAAYAVFATNTQQYPLVHETAWGGIVSSISYVTGDALADFGNTYYNDHHFHYGYFIYAAAVIGYLDPSWLETNKDYVNALVRDVANPSTEDNYFPVSRMFDWYHGHSWAHGLFETFDGKDEESSSEDSMHAYAIKMWGRTIGDANMEARGNLQLAITARSLQNYFLYTSNNINEPANFIGNKVSGILFENKIDHTTYFGTNIEYIEGIHMLPLLPSSTLTRTQEFVTQEWDTYFSDGRADDIVGGWKGILFANYAIINATASYQFFNQPDFNTTWLDGGASQTWYLALAAGLGGAS